MYSHIAHLQAFQQSQSADRRLFCAEGRGLLILVMNRTQIAAAALALLALGCSGVQSNAGGQTGEEQSPCWTELTPLGLDQESPLGFSPQDSLALAQGTHSATLHWLPSTQYPYGPESGDSELSVSVTALGRARFATRGDQRFDDLLCLPSVLSDVRVSFESAAGAFDETFDGLLIASDANVGTLSASLLGRHIAGSFAFEPATLAGQRLAQINLNVTFRAQAFSGTIAAMLETATTPGSNSSASARELPLACWGGAAPAGQAGCAE
jgi:hypothetical protein